MSRAAAFTQTDIARLLKGAKSAGVSVSRVEIDPTGKIVAHLGEVDASSTEGGGDEWDRAINAKKERPAKERH